MLQKTTYQTYKTITIPLPEISTQNYRSQHMTAPYGLRPRRFTTPQKAYSSNIPIRILQANSTSKPYQSSVGRTLPFSKPYLQELSGTNLGTASVSYPASSYPSTASITTKKSFKTPKQKRPIRSIIKLSSDSSHDFLFQNPHKEAFTITMDQLTREIIPQAPAEDSNKFGVGVVMIPTPPLEKALNQVSGVYIKQVYNAQSIVTGCGSKNAYYVSGMLQDGSEGLQTLKCYQKTDFFQKHCWSKSASSIDFMLYNLLEGDKPCIELKKEYSWNLFSIRSPKIRIFYTESKREYIGMVEVHETCDKYSYLVRGVDHQILYTIDGHRCQPGICCECAGQSCQNAQFTLWKGSRVMMFPYPIVKKGRKSCCGGLMGNSGVLSVPFPEDSGFAERVLLVMAALVLDYMLFDEDILCRGFWSQVG